MQVEIDDFFTYCASEKGLSINTIEAYKRDIGAFKEYLASIQITDWKEVSQEDIIQFLSQRKSQGYASASNSRVMVAIKVFFRFLKREGVCTDNPALHLESLKQWQKIPEVLNAAEIQRLLEQPDLESLSGSRDKAIMELLYASGIRVSELCRLNIQDVDDKFIRVRNGKGGKERIVPVGRLAIEALDYYCNKRPETDNESLFLTNRGNRMTRSDIWSMIKEYAEKARITKSISPHTFRHTCATDLMRNGADIRIIQDILGHADISSTQRYAHVDCSELQSAFQSCHPRYKE